MSKVKKIAILITALFLFVSTFAGCGSSSGNKTTETTAVQTTMGASESAAEDPAANFKELKITVLGWAQTGTKRPTEDVLTPIWRGKTKVIPEIIVRPESTSRDQWIQMQIVANTLPDIITTNGVLENPEILAALVKAGKLREITQDMFENSLPRFKARVEKYGMKMDEVYQDNLRSDDKKLWYIPSGQMPSDFVPAFLGTRMSEYITGTFPPNYSFMIRDDVLKQIYPNAKTEDELRKLYIEKGGNLTEEDVLDIPIRDINDMYEFLKKVKALNLKAPNGKPLIPAQLDAQPVIDAIRWSWGVPATRLADWGSNHQFLDTFALNGDQLIDFTTTPEWKETIKFINKSYNEGLIDREAYVQKQDQLDAKIAAGEYAVINGWANWSNLRKAINDNKWGFGLRMLPWNFPEKYPQTWDTRYADLSWVPTTYKAPYSAIGITTNIKDEDMAQVLNWIDWNLSEEADELRYWGPPEFSTGEGADRRFKPEYKELEDWALYDIRGTKDGWYYGLTNNDYGKIDDFQEWNHEVHGVGFYNYFYPDAPRYVYPRNPKYDDNIEAVTIGVIKTANKDRFKLYKKPVEFDSVANTPEYLKIRNSTGWRSQDGKDAIAKAIVGKEEDFDKNYATFQKLQQDPGYVAGVAALAQKWKEVFDAYIKPARDAAAAGK